MQISTLAAIVLASVTLVAAQDCPFTEILPAPGFGCGQGTSTKFARTATLTNMVECSGCQELVTSTRFLGVGPVCPSITATITDKVTTSQTYVCSPTV